jgi:hypothetical protein
MNLDQIRKDVQSFSDDESQVITTFDGGVLFTRQEKEVLFRVIEDRTTGATLVEYEGRRIPYRVFLSHEIARLEVFATRLIEKRSTLNNYVDSPSELRSMEGAYRANGLELLERTCAAENNATKITFLTADAGQGKTMLLKEFQALQAKKFLSKESPFLFWHIDLQGRQLVRLNEAIMYDLGELRISGLGIYYSSILTLVRHGLLILAIDGFDELSAEIGGPVALGALSHLVDQLEGQGTIIAASRRTFFNTQDYVKRNAFLRSNVSIACEFKEIKLDAWKEMQVLEYLHNSGCDDPDQQYLELLHVLNDDPSHPILTRPFLLTRIIDLMIENPTLLLNDIATGSLNPIESVAIVVDSFVRREVSKWKLRDSETGQPYLTFEQHMHLLEFVADEMWLGNSDRIRVEDLEFFATSLCEEWGIDPIRRQKVVNMVRNHALLVAQDIDQNFRRFEHEEFRNYFLALSLVATLRASILGKDLNRLRKFLYISQLPDSVAYYAGQKLPKSEQEVVAIFSILSEIIESEWKPTYLQQNIGTIVPSLLNAVNFLMEFPVLLKLTYSSLVFEGKNLRNVIFGNATFINVSFRQIRLENVTFSNCLFNDLRIFSETDNVFSVVTFRNDCEISILSEYSKEGEHLISFYNPADIRIRLRELGFMILDIVNDDSSFILEPQEISIFKKALLRFLSGFQKSTIQYESNVEDGPFYKQSKTTILEEVIPFLSKNLIISKREKSKIARQVLNDAWGLDVELEELLRSENIQTRNRFTDFWDQVKNWK